MSVVIETAIRRVRDEFLRMHSVASYFAINNGLCEDFAIHVILQLGSPAHLSDLGNESFQDEKGGWDWELLEKYWGMKAPEGLTRDEVDGLDFGGHIFIADHGERRFYDAECPEGVSSFFDLPLFRRDVVQALRSKGMRVDEFLPEDVVPAPCSSAPIALPEFDNSPSP